MRKENYYQNTLTNNCNTMVFGTGYRSDGTEGRGGAILGGGELFPPFYAVSTYVEWRSTDCKFENFARDATYRTTGSIYLAIFLHQMNQTKRGTTVRLLQQLLEKKNPSTDNASQSLARSASPLPLPLCSAVAAASEPVWYPMLPQDSPRPSYWHRPSSSLSSTTLTFALDLRPDQTRPDQTSPDRTGPDQTRPDQTRPDQTGPG